MPVVANDIVRVSLRVNLPSFVESYNIFTLRAEASFTDAAWVAMLDNWFTAMHNTIKSRIHSSVIWNDHRSVIPASAYEVGSGYIALAGTAASDLLPHGVSALTLGLTTNIKVRGRKYLAGLTEGSVGSDGLWASTMVTQLASYALFWTSVYTVSTVDQHTPGVVQTNTGAFMPFMQWRTSNVPAYQRRRRPDRS